MKSQYPGISVVRRFFLTGRRPIWYKWDKVKSVDLRSSGQDSIRLSGSQRKETQEAQRAKLKNQNGGVPAGRLPQFYTLLFAF
jgi:hypothetical protein